MSTVPYEQAIADAGAWWAETRAQIDERTPREVAEHVVAGNPDVDVDAVEDKVRRLRGLPALDRTAAA